MPQIACYPNKCLYQPCIEVVSNPATAECVDRLKSAVNVIQTCLGLAANQLGENLRIFIMKISGALTIVVNPRIISASEEMVVEREYCLSLPDVSRLVERHSRVHVAFENEEFATQELPLSHGVFSEARVFQHELDHLDGITILERAGQGLLSANKLKAMTRKYRGWRYV